MLPPWSNIYHWSNRNQQKIEWSHFFDVASLSKYTPVIEFKEYLKKTSTIDQVFYLQNYKEGWTNGVFEEKYDFRACNEEAPYLKDDVNDLFYGYFWGYEDSVSAKNFSCVSYQGFTSVMEKLLKNYSHLKYICKNHSFEIYYFSRCRSIFIDRAEVMLHESYGQVEYWKVRSRLKREVKNDKQNFIIQVSSKHEIR